MFFFLSRFQDTGFRRREYLQHLGHHAVFLGFLLPIPSWSLKFSLLHWRFPNGSQHWLVQLFGSYLHFTFSRRFWVSWVWGWRWTGSEAEEELDFRTSGPNFWILVWQLQYVFCPGTNFVEAAAAKSCVSSCKLLNILFLCTLKGSQRYFWCRLQAMTHQEAPTILA